MKYSVVCLIIKKKQTPHEECLLGSNLEIPFLLTVDLKNRWYLNDKGKEAKTPLISRR